MNAPDATLWTQEEAISLCRQIEAICQKFGCHVALTGGLLYKDGPRKDCDIVFYRIRQAKEIDTDGLIGALKPLGVEFEDGGFGWCFKAWLNPVEKPIDCFFPEEIGGEYNPEAHSAATTIENPEILI